MKKSPHPGKILKENFLNRFQVSPNALSVAIFVSSARISEIVRGRR